MPNDELFDERPVPRVATGIRGLDLVLNGGLLEGGIYLFMAPPGGGKTILANQIVFNQATAGRRTIYVTLLAESHSRMFTHLRSLHFFDRDRIPDTIQYLSGYQVLENEGLDGLLSMLRQLVFKERPTILVLDGLAIADELSNSAVAFKKFVHQLNSITSTASCTTLLLASLVAAETRPEHTMVDGIIAIAFERLGMRLTRQVEVKKFRGSDHLPGSHVFRIDGEGVHVFPRAETYLPTVVPVFEDEPPFVSTGVQGLDTMLGGGVLQASTTLLYGAPGTGKTILASHFIAAGALAGETSVFFGLYESPARLRRKLLRLGVDFVSFEQAGRLVVAWQPPVELDIDELALRILEAVKTSGAKRLVLDGLSGIRSAAGHPERVALWLAAVTNELRLLGVTTLLTEETPALPTEQRAGTENLSAFAENAIHLRQSEVDGGLAHSLTVLKIREGEYDRRVRDFRILADQGVVLGADAAPGRRSARGTKQAAAPRAGASRQAKGATPRKQAGPKPKSKPGRRG